MNIEEIIEDIIYDFDYEEYEDKDTLLMVAELASRFSVQSNLELIAIGGSRGVFKLTEDTVMKVNFEEGYIDNTATGENALWELVNSNSEFHELSKYLVPIKSHNNRVTVMPLCNKVNHEHKDEISEICTKFKEKGIHLFDVDGNLNNAGILNGKVVILDYDEWIQD